MGGLLHFVGYSKQVTGRVPPTQTGVFCISLPVDKYSTITLWGYSRC